MPKKKPNELIKEQGFIEVSSTGLDGKKTKKIKVRPFVGNPAHVEVKFGTWFPTGNMEGAKVDVSIRVPCYPEEIVSVFNQTVALADKLIEQEISRLRGDDVDDEEDED